MSTVVGDVSELRSFDGESVKDLADFLDLGTETLETGNRIRDFLFLTPHTYCLLYSILPYSYPTECTQIFSFYPS